MTCVPTTLVRMKAPGSVIERSTWLSAARCITASGRNVGVEGVHGRRIADVGLDEAVARVVRQGLERDRVGRVGQRVERRDLVSEILHEVQHQGRSDEAAAAGHQDAHGMNGLS